MNQQFVCHYLSLLRLPVCRMVRRRMGSAPEIVSIRRHRVAMPDLFAGLMIGHLVGGTRG